MKRFVLVLCAFLLLLPVPAAALGESGGETIPEASEREPDGGTLPEASEVEPQGDGGFDALYDEQKSMAGADELEDLVPEEARGFLEAFGLGDLDPDALLNLDLGELIGYLWTETTERFGAPLRMLCQILGVVLLCALLDTLGGGKESALTGVFRLVAVLFLCAVMLSPLLDCARRASELISAVSGFLLAFIPVFAGVLILGGRTAAASVYHLTLFGVVEGISAVVSSVLTPLLFCYIAFCMATSVGEELQIGRIAALIKKGVSWTLGIGMTVLLGFLSLQTLVAEGADTVAAKATRFFISSTVPVVGSALSDALLTVKGCVGLLRASVGAFGILIVAAAFLPMLVELAAWSIALRLGAMAAGAFGQKTVTTLLESVAAAVGMLAAMLCCYLLLVTLSTTIVMLAGGH